jgi:hypothetical protein
VTVIVQDVHVIVIVFHVTIVHVRDIVLVSAMEIALDVVVIVTV